MNNIFTKAAKGKIIQNEKQDYIIEKYLLSINKDISQVLILPPDASRRHSGAGKLTNILFNKLKKKIDVIDIIPALGTHDPMSEDSIRDMFGDIPIENFIQHRWREDTIKVGEIPADFICNISGGIIDNKIEIKINKHIVSGKYDLIISIGQVVPHEVVGMANYTKNVVIGSGGKEIINKSHFLGAAYGMEKIMGRDNTPVRKIYDYIENNIINDLPISYILTVNKSEIDKKTGIAGMVGIFCGRERSIFEKAVELSQNENITFLEKPAEKFLVYLDPEEYNSTWLGNKAIYRTRMAVANGGEIIIVAPGLRKFGEDEHFDKLIRKYGYVGRDKILKFVERNDELRNDLAVAAHLIHGSSEGRFSITYASNSMSEEEIRKVNYNYLSIDKIHEKYDIENLELGSNRIKGEEIYFINNPSLGLWVFEDKFSK